jgi:protein-L-isoaspartate(D-aspartate) O-methyltransferase
MIDFAQLRQSMVDSQIRANDVTDPRILAAMLELPRERFAPEDRRGLAYIDDDLPLRDGATGKPARYLIEPMVLAKLVQALDIDAEDRVLDVGTATGYSAALLGRLAASVVALEEDPGLAATAAKLLADLDAVNVRVATGPLTAGWPADKPYDAILVNGSVEIVPEELLSQLAEGGRIGAVTRNGNSSRATIYTRVAGSVASRPVFDAAVPPLPGFAAPKTFVF